MLLDELPNEILLNVFQYVPSEELWRNARPICRRINAILQTNGYWTSRAQKHFGFRFPERLKPVEDRLGATSHMHDIPQSTAVEHCAAVEKSFDCWSSTPNGGGLTRHKFHQLHYGTVDAVSIFKSQSADRHFVWTGARDRSIILWDLEAVFNNDEKPQWTRKRLENAHEGWIWALATPNEHSLYSASWDSKIRQWLITDSEVIKGATLNLEAAVLSCICTGDNLIYASTYRSGPILFDSRVGTAAVRQLNVHNSKSVYDMTTNDSTNYIYTIGEDNRLVSVDKRIFNPLHALELDTHASHIDCNSDYLALSLRNGLLKFLHPETFDTENEIQMEVRSSHNGHLCMKVAKGCTVCAYDYKMKVFTAGASPQLLDKIDVEASVTKMDLQDGKLVAAMGMGSVYFWQGEP